MQNAERKRFKLLNRYKSFKQQITNTETSLFLKIPKFFLFLDLSMTDLVLKYE